MNQEGVPFPLMTCPVPENAINAKEEVSNSLHK